METLQDLYSILDQTILWGLGIFILLLLLLSAACFLLRESVISRESSLQLTYILFQILWAPFAMIFNLPLDITSEAHMTPLGFTADENRWRRFCQGPAWIRQVLFVLVVLGPDRVMMIHLSVCWCCAIWLISYLCSVLIVNQPAETTPSSYQRLCRKGVAVIALLGVLLYSSCYHSVAEMLGCLFFLALTDASLQKFLQQQCSHTRLQWLEGLDEDYVLGAMVTVDISQCLLLALLSLQCCHFFLGAVAMVNSGLGALNFWCRVWQPLQEKLGRMRGFRRASRKELRDHNDVCPVCLTAMKMARVTMCGHLFHGCCLRQSLEVSSKCPVCKTVVDSEQLR